MSAPHMKCVGAQWLVRLYEHRLDSPQIIINGFLASGIPQSIDKGTPYLAEELDSTEEEFDSSQEEVDTTEEEVDSSMEEVDSTMEESNDEDQDMITSTEFYNYFY